MTQTYPNRGAQLLAERLQTLGLGYADVGKRLNVSRQAVHAWLRTDKAQRPGLELLVGLQRWLGIPESAWTEPPETPVDDTPHEPTAA